MKYKFLILVNSYTCTEEHHFTVIVQTSLTTPILYHVTKVSPKFGKRFPFGLHTEVGLKPSLVFSQRSQKTAPLTPKLLKAAAW
jgi:hypothetical protein